MGGEAEDRSQARIQALLRQLSVQTGATPASTSELRWNGWGYADTTFGLNQNGHVVLSGSRYQFSGAEMPEFRPFMEERGVRVDRKAEPKKLDEIELAGV
jgi:hypothetical protein